jgi:hypothetical protein
LDPAATIRAYYYLHANTNDGGDIGYHFLIDEAGRIYEGRYTGMDGIPAHDAGGKMVTAFHTSGFNSGNLGIALLGTFESQADCCGQKVADPVARGTVRLPRPGPRGGCHLRQSCQWRH